MIRTSEQDRLLVSANPAKWFQGHNQFGSDDLLGLVATSREGATSLVEGNRSTSWVAEPRSASWCGLRCLTVGWSGSERWIDLHMARYHGRSTATFVDQKDRGMATGIIRSEAPHA